MRSQAVFAVANKMCLTIVFLDLSLLSTLATSTSIDASPEMYRVWRPMGIGGGPPVQIHPMQILVHPTGNGTVYLLTDKYGLYRSDDYGASWFDRTTRLHEKVPAAAVSAVSNFMISEVAYNMSDKTYGTITVTAGSGTPTASISGGLYHSEDGGETWHEHPGLSNPSFATCGPGCNSNVPKSGSGPVWAIAFSTRDPNIVYLGSGLKSGCSSPGDGRGPRLFVSEDGGKTWLAQLQFAVQVECMSVEQIIVDPTNVNTTYVRTSDGSRYGTQRVGGLLMTSLNKGADLFDVLSSVSGFPTAAYTTSKPRALDMTMTALGDLWALAFSDGSMYLCSRTVKYPQRVGTYIIDYTAVPTVSAWQAQQLVAPSQFHLFDVVRFDPHMKNDTLLFYSKKNSSVGDGLYFSNITGSPGSFTFGESSTEVGEVTMSRRPGYDLTKWELDDLAVSPLTHRGSQTLYASCGRTFHYCNHRLDSGKELLTTAFAEWDARYTRSPQGVHGAFHTRGFDRQALTFMVTKADDPLQMWMGSQHDFGFYSIDGGGTWTPQADLANEGSREAGDHTLWIRTSAAGALYSRPNMFLIAAYSIPGKPGTDYKEEGKAGLFLQHDLVYTYMNISENATDMPVNVEVLAVTGDSWHPDRALIGIGGLIMQLSNLEAVADRSGVPNVTTFGHNIFLPTYINGSNTSGFNATWVYGDNTYYIGDVGRVNELSTCEWCGYETFFAACNNSVLRYNATGKPKYEPHWDAVLTSPKVYYKRNVIRRRSPAEAYIKYEYFKQVVASQWGTVYVMSNISLYASDDGGRTFAELFLASMVGPDGIKTAYDLLYPGSPDTISLMFNSVACSSSLERQIFVSVEGQGNAFKSAAVLIGTQAGTDLALTWQVMDQGATKGQLSSLHMHLYGAIPIGVSLRSRIYAMADNAGAWLLDGGNMLPNPSAELDTNNDEYPDFWTASHPRWTVTTPMWSNTKAAYGYYSLHLPEADTSWTSDFIVVDPSHQMRLRGWTSGRVRCRVIMYRDTQVTQHLYVDAPESLAIGGWREFRVDFILDLHTTEVQVRVEPTDSLPYVDSAADQLWFGPVVNDVVPDSLEPQMPVQGMNVSVRPEAPRPPYVAGVTATTMTLAWVPPPGSEYLEMIKSYKIGQRASGDSSAPYKTVATVGNVLSHTVTGLSFGTQYQFTLTASTAVGPSNMSVPLVAFTGADVPSVPGNPKLYGVASSHELEIYYDPPSSDGNSPITGYLVQILDPNTGQYSAGSGYDASGRAKFYGLMKGVPYYFKVSAVNIVGKGPSTKASEPIMTADEAEANVTMRFYENKAVRMFPLGIGTMEDFQDLLSLDIARALAIPKARVNITRVTGVYISFWIRSMSETSKKPVTVAREEFVMNVVDKTSILHGGTMSWQTDTHFLLLNGAPADLAAARARLGGPGKRLEAGIAVLSGICVFMIVPAIIAGKTFYAIRARGSTLEEAYKTKYSDKGILQ